MLGIKRILIIAVLLPVFGHTQTSSNLWIDLGVKGKITEKLSWRVRATNRFGPAGIERFFMQAGIKYKLTKWFRPGFDYRFSLDKDAYTNYQPSHRLMVALNFEKELIKRLDAGFRVRYQYDFSSWNRNYGYIQNVDHTIRFGPEFQYDIKKSVFSPAISAELFYSLERYNPYFYKVRISAGTDIELADPLVLNISYIFDRELFDQNNFPRIRHIINLGFTYALIKSE